MNRFIFFLLISLFSVHTVAQQPWVKERKQVYTQASFSYFGYGNIYISPTNRQKAIRPINQFIWSAYGEIGLSKRFMLTINVPFQRVSSGDADSTLFGIPAKGWMTGFGNIYGGLTVALVKKGNFSSSLTVGYHAKSARRIDASGLQTGVQAHGIETMFAGGWGFENNFLSIGIGLNARTNGYVSQALYKIQWGSRIGKKKRAWFILGGNIAHPAFQFNKGPLTYGPGSVDGYAASNYLYRENVAYIGIDVKFGYEFGNMWTAWGTLGGGPGWNIGMAPVWTVSLAKEFDWRKKKEGENGK